MPVNNAVDYIMNQPDGAAHPTNLKSLTNFDIAH